MRKTKPLRKQRFNPQISAAFGSGSIKIHADGVDLNRSLGIETAKALKSLFKISSHSEAFPVESDRNGVIRVSASV